MNRAQQAGVAAGRRADGAGDVLLGERDVEAAQRELAGDCRSVHPGADDECSRLAQSLCAMSKCVTDCYKRRAKSRCSADRGL